MRFRTPLLAVVATLLLATTTRAADELHLRWDNCSGDGGVYNKTFACDGNTGSETVVASYRLNQSVTNLWGIDAGIGITSLSGTFPSWWEVFNAGSCRPTSLTMSFDLPTTSTACLDPYGGQAAGGIIAYRRYATVNPTSNPNEAEMRASLGVPREQPFTVPAGGEVFAFQLRVSHARTVGSPSCTGCEEPVCLGLGWINLIDTTGAVVRSVRATATPEHESNVTWQPGAVSGTTVACRAQFPTVCYATAICEAVTPARRPTWGRIKSLYR